MNCPTHRGCGVRKEMFGCWLRLGQFEIVIPVEVVWTKSCKYKVYQLINLLYATNYNYLNFTSKDIYLGLTETLNDNVELFYLHYP